MQTLADEKQVTELIDRLAGEIGAAMRQTEGPWAVVGIRSRGDLLAGRMAQQLKPDHTGAVDITLYRDDLSEVGPQPVVGATDADFPMDGTNVLLVDDVLMTGRSVRAAIQSLLDFGRPRCIRLAVLADRGRRELPIAPDHVGQRINAAPGEQIEVHLKPHDAEDRIVLRDRAEATDASAASPQEARP